MHCHRNPEMARDPTPLALASAANSFFHDAKAPPVLLQVAAWAEAVMHASANISPSRFIVFPRRFDSEQETAIARRNCHQPSTALPGRPGIHLQCAAAGVS